MYNELFKQIETLEQHCDDATSDVLINCRGEINNLNNTIKIFEEISNDLDLKNMVLSDELKTSKALYNELLMQIGSKFPDETRHETALKYLRLAEKGQWSPIEVRE